MSGAILTYHLQPLFHRCGPLEVLGCGLNVPVNFLLGQIDHVGGEEWLVVLLEVRFICVHHAVEPWQQLLCAVVGVQYDWDTVGWSHRSDVVGCGDGTSDRGFLVLVTYTLHVSSASLVASTDVFIPCLRSKQHHPAKSAR